jgi:hypothetical protein
MDKIRERTYTMEIKSQPKEENMQEKINEDYDILKDRVKKLDTIIETVLQKHEQDFLNAFKIQMFNLHSQLKELKKKTDENEIRLKRDEKIKKMQESLEWFREEAVKLGESTQLYKKEAEKWKAKAESLESDRVFLENQLKNTKRKIKILQNTQDKDYEDILKTSAYRKYDQDKINFIPSTKIGEIILEYIQKNTSSIDQLLYDLEKFFNDLEIKYKESLRHVKNNLDAEKKKFKSVSANQNSLFFVKTDMENLFLDCVEEVRKEISKRKTQNLAKQKFMKSSYSVERDDRLVMSSSDKRKVLELLICNEKVLTMIYEKLFPYRANSYGTTFKTEEKNEEDKLPSIEEMIKLIPAKPNTAKVTLSSAKAKF